MEFVIATALLMPLLALTGLVVVLSVYVSLRRRLERMQDAGAEYESRIQSTHEPSDPYGDHG